MEYAPYVIINFINQCVQLEVIGKWVRLDHFVAENVLVYMGQIFKIIVGVVKLVRHTTLKMLRLEHTGSNPVAHTNGL